MLQLGPRGERGVEVFLRPFGVLHEVGQLLLLLLVVERFQGLHPLGDDGFTPVDLAHALFHLGELGFEVLPLGLLLHEDLLGGADPHSSEEVETLGNGSLGDLAVVVDHLLQHLGIGLVTLGHQTDLVVAGLLELRTDAGLLVADLLEGQGDALDGLVVMQQFAHGQVLLLHLGDDLRQADIVRLAHQEGDELVERVVLLHGCRLVFHSRSDHHGLLHFLLVIHTEGGCLEPHHASEVALQLLRTGVVTTGTEEAEGELDFHVVLEERAEAVL